MARMDLDNLKPVVEALIFAADEPLPLKQIKALVEDTTDKDIQKVIDQLNVEYSQANRAISVNMIGGGYQMVTRPKYAPWIRKFFQKRIQTRLSHAALEALSVIAFKQPVSRVEVDAIRGVNSDGVIRTLLERKLITMAGRADGPGRPLLYKTTQEFLQHFGVNDLADLPKPKELEELMKEETAGEAEKDQDVVQMDVREGEVVIEETGQNPPEVVGEPETEPDASPPPENPEEHAA